MKIIFSVLLSTCLCQIISSQNIFLLNITENFFTNSKSVKIDHGFFAFINQSILMKSHKLELTLPDEVRYLIVVTEAIHKNGSDVQSDCFPIKLGIPSIQNGEEIIYEEPFLKSQVDKKSLIVSIPTSKNLIISYENKDGCIRSSSILKITGVLGYERKIDLKCPAIHSKKISFYNEDKKSKQTFCIDNYDETMVDLFKSIGLRFEDFDCALSSISKNENTENMNQTYQQQLIKYMQQINSQSSKTTDDSLFYKFSYLCIGIVILQLVLAMGKCFIFLRRLKNMPHMIDPVPIKETAKNGWKPQNISSLKKINKKNETTHIKEVIKKYLMTQTTPFKEITNKDLETETNRLEETMKKDSLTQTNPLQTTMTTDSMTQTTSIIQSLTEVPDLYTAEQRQRIGSSTDIGTINGLDTRGQWRFQLADNETDKWHEICRRHAYCEMYGQPLLLPNSLGGIVVQFKLQGTNWFNMNNEFGIELYLPGRPRENLAVRFPIRLKVRVELILANGNRQNSIQQEFMIHQFNTKAVPDTLRMCFSQTSQTLPAMMFEISDFR